MSAQPSATPRRRAPGPVVALRILLGVEAVLGAMGLAFGLLVAVANSTQRYQQENSFADLARVLGLIIAVAGAVALVAGALLLRAAVQRRPGTAVAVLATHLPVALLAVPAVGSVGPRVAAVLLLPAVPAAVALTPAARSWFSTHGDGQGGARC